MRTDCDDAREGQDWPLQVSSRKYNRLKEQLEVYRLELDVCEKERDGWKAEERRQLRAFEDAAQELGLTQIALNKTRKERDMLAQAMVDYRAEAQYQERERAAAEARVQKARELIREADRHTRPGGLMDRILSRIDDALQSDHAALDAALDAALEGREQEVIDFAMGVAEKHAEGYEEHWQRYHSQGKYTKAYAARQCMDAATMIFNDIEGGY
jgi:chromosome segregation ATPase